MDTRMYIPGLGECTITDVIEALYGLLCIFRVDYNNVFLIDFLLQFLY